MAPPKEPILAEFDAFLDKCERRNYAIQRFYYPQSSICEWIEHNAKLLLAAVTPSEKLYDLVELTQLSRRRLVFAVLLSLGYGSLIPLFCKLDWMTDESLKGPIHHKGLAGALRDEGTEDAARIVDEFNRKRREFCPISISMKMEKNLEASCILPFCKKEQVNVKGGTANVHKVLIREDLLSDCPALTDAISWTKHEDPDFGACYTFAIKTYRANYRDVYTFESDAFKTLQNAQGVIRYLGEYTIPEVRDNGEFETTHNILLEFGEFDLEEVLAAVYPPVLNEEILSFWQSIFKVAETIRGLHVFENRRHNDQVTRVNGWHGDIKPDNILQVHGEYKLADFGFAKFKTEVLLAGTVATTKLSGGTDTYGAPEWENGRDQNEYSQAIDTWSFGCVLSAVATWVILGSVAYKQYGMARREAILKLKERRRNEGKPSNIPRADDAFHDGHDLLPIVKDWHNYLRHSLRTSDTVSGQILDLVEGEMLVSDPAKRLSFTQLCTRLTFIVDSAKSSYTETILRGKLRDLSPQLLQLLLLEDISAPEVAAPGFHPSYIPETQENNLSSNKSRRVGKSERMDQIRRGKVGGRADALRNLTQDTLKHPVPRLIIDDYNSHSTSRRTVEYDNGMAPAIHATGHNYEPASPLQYTTATETPGYDTHFKANAAPRYSPTVSNIALPLSRAQTGTEITNKQLFWSSPIGETRTQLNEEWEKKTFLLGLWNRVPKDPILQEYIVNRDIIFLVDNGWSMSQHWDLATLVVETLGMKIGRLDKNGLDLCFTLSPKIYDKYGVKGFDIRKVFGDAMKAARANQRVHATDMNTAIRRRFSAYLSDSRKKLTIVVLTDGVWDSKADSVKDTIKGFVKKIREEKGFTDPEERPCSIQFISFGNDHAGLQRLKDLDDHMEDIEDVIDTEPWDGNPFKMLVGSFKPGVDGGQQLSAQGPSGSNSIPPRLSIPHQHSSSQGQSHGSGSPSPSRTASIRNRFSEYLSQRQ